MKITKTINTVLVIGIALLTITVNAQKKYATFNDKGGEEFALAITDKGTVYMDMEKDGSYGVILKDKEIASFTEFIESSYAKYLEWETTALENDVTDMMKDIKSKTSKIFFRYGKWQFGNTSLKTIFSVSESGTPAFYLYGPKTQSSGNQYIKSKSAMLSLSKETVDGLVEGLSKETRDGFLNNDSKKDALFKN